MPSIARIRLFILALISAIGLVYASILPVEFVAMPLDQAIKEFWQIPWLNLGVGRRADWVANGLVLLPFGFFAAGAADRDQRATLRYLAWLILIALTGMVLVVAIEFLQIWFPQRTLSQNDIAAGIIGAALGPCLWPLLGRPMLASLPRIQAHTSELSDNQSLVRWLLLAYCVSLLLYSILPLDLMLHGAEWNTKYQGGRFTWLPFLADFSVEGMKSLTPLAYALLISAARMIPIGFLSHRSLSHKTGIQLIIFLPIIIELLQAPIFTRYTTFADILCGWCGGLAGWAIAEHRRKIFTFNQYRSVRFTLLITAVAAVLFLFLGHAKRLATKEEIARDWSNFYSPPFAKYYWMDEFQAGSNAVGKLMAFATVGFLFANLTNQTNRKLAINSTPRLLDFLVLIVIFCLAMTIEIAQVYLHPFIGDGSDILLYLFGGFLGIAMHKRLSIPSKCYRD